MLNKELIERRTTASPGEGAGARGGRADVQAAFCRDAPRRGGAGEGVTTIPWFTNQGSCLALALLSC